MAVKFQILGSDCRKQMIKLMSLWLLNSYYEQGNWMVIRQHQLIGTDLCQEPIQSNKSMDLHSYTLANLSNIINTVRFYCDIQLCTFNSLSVCRGEVKFIQRFICLFFKTFTLRNLILLLNKTI